jgi:hypothetical protein
MTLKKFGDFKNENKLYEYTQVNSMIDKSKNDDFKKYNKITESTQNYYPGYSDDGTADNLSDIRTKTSIIQNTEIRNKKDKIFEPFKDDTKQTFYQKWMYANMILTSLQDGFYMDRDLVEEAFVIYKELLSEENLESYREEEKDPAKFARQLTEVILRLSELLKGNDLPQGLYAPGFMNREDRIEESVKENH